MPETFGLLKIILISENAYFKGFQDWHDFFSTPEGLTEILKIF